MVKAWWNGNPEAGIGLVIPSNLVVLDIERESGLQYLKYEDKEIPPSLTALTGGGGFHFWYSLPTGLEVSRRIRVLPDIDLLVNGYVAAPPCLHPNGKHYQWKGSFDTRLIQEAPEWIVDYLKTSEKYEADKVDPKAVLEGISEGNRDNYLWRYACYLRGQRQMTKEEALVLIRFAASQCAPPFNLEIAEGKVERAWQYAKEEMKKFKPAVYKPAELAKAGIPPPRFIVWHRNERGRKDGFVVPGLTIVSSVSKAGKSNLIAFIVGHIAAGKRLWNHYDVENTGVLYIDLEQGQNFATLRLKDMFDDEIPMALDVVHEWPRMGEGGLEALKDYILENPHIGVVVIDLLGLFWPVEVKMEGNAYQKEYFVLGKLKKFANDLGIALIVVHHNNKGSGKDQITSISGTMAMSGVVDAMFNLERAQGDVMAVLRTSGKNIPAHTLSLQYNPNNFKWTMKGIE